MTPTRLTSLLLILVSVAACANAEDTSHLTARIQELEARLASQQSQSVSFAVLGSMPGLSLAIEGGPFSSSGELTPQTALLLHLDSAHATAVTAAEQRKRTAFAAIIAHLAVTPHVGAQKMVLEIPDLTAPCHELELAWDQAMLDTLGAERRNLLLRLLNGTLNTHALGAGRRTIAVTRHGEKFDWEDTIRYPEGQSSSTTNENETMPDTLLVFKPLIPSDFGGSRPAEPADKPSEF